MRERRIGVLTQKPHDGTSWYRAVLPLTELQKRQGAGKVSFHFFPSDGTEYDWNHFCQFDAVFAQRPVAHVQLAILEKVKDMGLPLWVEYDDNLFDVPLANPGHEYFSNPQHKDSVAKILKLADVVTVTNEDLASAYRGMSDNVRIVPNAQADFILDNPKHDKNRNCKVIAWRGSRTHDEDCDEFLPEIIKLANEHQDWKWLFLGRPYFKLVNNMPRNRTLVVDHVRLPKYIHFLRVLQADIAIVPLKDNFFNRCKSNIAWQEFTYTGASCVVPNWEHWNRPGVTTYSSKETFYDAVKYLMTQPERRLENWQQSWVDLNENYRLSKVNALRWEITRELLGLGE